MVKQGKKFSGILQDGVYLQNDLKICFELHIISEFYEKVRKEIKESQTY